MLDFCNECGVAVDVRLDNGHTVYVCRNPQCGQFAKPLELAQEGGDENG